MKEDPTGTLLQMYRSRLDKQQVMEYISKDPELLKQSMAIALGDMQPESRRACWVVSGVMQADDERFTPYIDQAIEAVSNRPDGHARELLKWLDRTKLTEDQEGLLFDTCLTIWRAVHRQPSVRVVALTHVFKIVKKYPGLTSELDLVMASEYLEALSPGIRRTVEKAWKDWA